MIRVLLAWMLFCGVASAADWPQVSVGKITEVKGFKSLPMSLQKMPAMEQCQNEGCEPLITKFYKVGEDVFAFVPLQGMYEMDTIFQLQNDSVIQLSFPMVYSSVGILSVDRLGETTIDAKTGKLVSSFFEDSCDAKTTTSEVTYELNGGTYYLTKAREGVGCKKLKWRTIWQKH